MPTYGYECTSCNERFEVFQRITEDPLTEHEGCGGSVRRLLYPVGIVFKGSGFYVNDYARKSGSAGSGSDKPARPDTAGKAETPEAKPAESAAKPAD